ncbi:MAG: ArsA family ATPase [Anaerolineae bacterium]|nr:ArsA family ATPase [Anaerolineae bacterium]MCX8068002.1 ArsA family ATPase [Anaerolineae bacterium]MDW7992945.1 ArsA family ATPase [Anaerolineae bacterium]
MSANLSELERNPRRVLMFGGKGGVGKTTSSAATALHFARRGFRTLIISSDLTPSLSDIFETEIGPTERPIPGVENLYGLEIDPDEVMRRWKEKFGPEVYAAASALVDLPYDEVVDYVAMAPGIQEEFMLDYILERVRDRRYDLVVWDTAPAGDTLRLLGLPQRFLEHLRVAPRVYLEVRDTLKLSRTPFIEIIESWKQLSEQTIRFFTDPQNVEFILVTIPEALGVYQSRRVLRDLRRHGLTVRYLIINDIIRNPDCEFHRQRWEMQQRYIRQLREELDGHLTLVELPLLPYEVKGVERLAEVEAYLFGVGR